MSMDTNTRQAIRQGQEDAADIRTCPSCSRRGAIVTVDIGDRLVTYCKWRNAGLCEWPGVALFHIDGDVR